MGRIFFALFLLFGLLYAQSISIGKYNKLVEKGEKVALSLCDETKLSQIKTTDLNTTLQQIEILQPCTGLNTRNKEALAYFLIEGHVKHDTETKGQIEVPKEVKCPVCGMFVSKYPKWVATIEVEKHTHYFDGVKDMMKFYIFDVDFPYDRNKISHMEVTDFYTLKAIEAKEAFYVIGSNVYGPMGNELIPFESKDAAQNFKKDHDGEKIILFPDITPKLVMGLDGLEYND